MLGTKYISIKILLLVCMSEVSFASFKPPELRISYKNNSGKEVTKEDAQVACDTLAKPFLVSKGLFGYGVFSKYTCSIDVGDAQFGKDSSSKKRTIKKDKFNIVSFSKEYGWHLKIVHEQDALNFQMLHFPPLSGKMPLRKSENYSYVGAGQEIRNASLFQ